MFVPNLITYCHLPLISGYAGSQPKDLQKPTKLFCQDQLQVRATIEGITVTIIVDCVQIEPNRSAEKPFFTYPV